MHMCSVSFASKMGNMWSPDPSAIKLAMFLAQDYYLQVNGNGNDLPVTCFILSIWESKLLTWSPLSPVQEIQTGG